MMRKTGIQLMYTRTYCPILAVLIYWSGCCTTAAYVMGEDDRQEVSRQDSTVPEIGQTGLIRFEDDRFVTGILTGANCDVVVTAGHAAVAGQAGIIGRRIFQLDREIQPRGPVTMNLVKSGLQLPGDIEDDSRDWAIFRLSAPLLPVCKSFVYIPYGTSCDGQVMMPGYHFDRRDKKLIDRSCKIRGSMGNRTIIHDCDTKDGSSGAPLLCAGMTGIRLLGINVSGLKMKELVDPGEYGKASRNFNYKSHKNFAVIVHGQFLRTLEEELAASRQRRAQAP